MAEITNNDQARNEFSLVVGSYERLTPRDIYALEGYIQVELAAFSRDNETAACEMRISRKKKTRTRIKRNPSGGISRAFIRVDGSYFEGREAVSFNPGGFIGIAGWADQYNSVPFLRAFGRWLSEYMVGAPK